MGVPVVGSMMRKMFGSRNDRMVKRYLRIVDEVSAFEPEMRRLTDPELREKTEDLRKRLADGANSQDVLPEVFAVAREAMDRSVGIRNIFNPDENFDPATLPDAARRLYDETKKIVDETPDREPTGDLLGNKEMIPAWRFVDIPVELYEAVRELYPQSKPPFRARPFDVQIIGAIVLYEGRIAEMKTGEGKTIVAPLATYLSVLEGNQVHIITVNDYLVQRDRDWTAPFFRSLGLTVGAIHPMHMQSPQEKFLAYQCDVIYGTTSEFGFDYLRDNMKLSLQEQMQKKRNFAIVDEVDSTLIDEARTPLIISGQAYDHKPRYDMADRLARDLLDKQKDWNKADQKVQSCLVEISTIEGDIRNARDKDKVPALKQKLDAAKERLPGLEADRDQYVQYYEVELDKKRATITHAGIAEAQNVAGVGSFYVGDNIDIPHLLEQAIRAHTVYQRDRDYVVAPNQSGEPGIVIVDQSTGRKMPGRQWSDGLHQAIEAKEGVPIKEETQTMATITIQNFFKMYDKLAGMTGTADTEATEFYEIYKLDVVVIPTNVPVERLDHNDLVYIAEKDKWDAVVDEIKRFHDVGRPVLVGTTSVEKSEMISQMLKRRHNIDHEVLNAKQHERESEMVMSAGQLGAVMIATNMAGRGTDIKLGRISKEQIIDHWKRRGLAPRDVSADMSEDDIVAAVYRHIAAKTLEDVSKKDVEAMSDAEIQTALLRHWAFEFTLLSDGKINSADDETLREALDETGKVLLHRLQIFDNIEDLGGLHVIGTERHESRRIDNQLRGRSGRQGDNGSSRFFLSLEDDLMKMFAGETTLKVLSRLGMKEGDAIEHPMLTKAVGKAQRKVEERNFLSRKNLLEWDELPNEQRHDFYAMRQDVLEGRGVKEVIFDFIGESVEDATHTYLDKRYVANCIAEWVREDLSVSIDPDRFRGKDRDDLHRVIRIDSREEAGRMIEVTIGEYMPTDIDLGKGEIERSDRSQWNLQGLADWANSNFDAGIRASDLTDKEPAEVIPMLQEAADRKIDAVDLAPLDQFLVPHYGANELVKWARNKFECELTADDFEDMTPEQASDKLMQAARAAYAKREIEYPVDFAIDATTAMLQHDQQAAVKQFTDWVRYRYELHWTPNTLPSPDPRELRRILMEEAHKWDESRISERADRAIAQTSTPEELNTWLRENAGSSLSAEQLERAKDDPQSVAEERLAETLRLELTQFERWVLLQIIDGAWKDHLHSLDQLRESIGFRSFSQRDPRIEFKREGAALYEDMHSAMRDKVTDLIFKAKLTPQVRAPQPAPTQAAQRPAGDPGSGGAAPARRPAPQAAQPATAAAAAATGTATQERDIAQAEQAGTPQGGRKRQPVVRSAPAVGRNEPCPCGSGKKYKQCCGRKG